MHKPRTLLAVQGQPAAAPGVHSAGLEGARTGRAVTGMSGRSLKLWSLLQRLLWRLLQLSPCRRLAFDGGSEEGSARVPRGPSCNGLSDGGLCLLRMPQPMGAGGAHSFVAEGATCMGCVKKCECM